jgi:hypothetical protein
METSSYATALSSWCKPFFQAAPALGRASEFSGENVTEPPTEKPAIATRGAKVIAM